MIGLSSCAQVWGFDDLGGVDDAEQEGPDGRATDGAGDAGASGDGAGKTDGVGANADAAIADSSIPMDTRGGGGEPDASLPDGGLEPVDASVDGAVKPVDTNPADGSGESGANPADNGGESDATPVDSGVLGEASGPVAISIDFVGGGLPMAPTETAGVFPASRWNSATTALGTLTALVESNGTPSAASVAWDSGGTWQLPVPDAPGNTRMMIGYLDPHTSSNVVVSGLPAAFATSSYDVYVYTNGDVPAPITRSASYVIGALREVVTQPPLSEFSGAFVRATDGGLGNYVVFRGITGAVFTLRVAPVSGTGLRAPINGLQIVTAGAGP
jgi:hypothetical protein